MVGRMSLDEAHRQMATYRRLADWRTNVLVGEDAKEIDFDDGDLELVSPGWGWDRRSGDRWFRKEIVVPDRIHGIEIEGSRIDVRLVSLAGMELYLDGEFVDSAKYWFDVLFPLCERATRGQRHVVALRSPQADGWGHFNFAEMYVEALERMLLDVEVVDSRARLIREMSELGLVKRTKTGFEAANEASSLVPSGTDDLGRLHAIAHDYGHRIKPLARGLDQLTSFLAGHAHIDMNWLWDYDDTVDTSRRTFLSVDGLMDEFPEFIFSQSQAVVYRMMEVEEPEILEKIRRRVLDGRWDVTASTWVEGDLNMAGGESLVRQTTCALNYIEKTFGVTPRVAWCPDTFGHPRTYPQILSKCGIKYYYAHRCNRPEPEHLFWWESPDGSRVLVFNEGVTYNNTITPQLTRSFPKMLKHFGLPSHLVVFGVGDHGGGPTRRDLANAQSMNREEGFPRFRHVHAHEFFEDVRDSDRIPVVRDELNFVFEGCYTTHADIKRMNRRGEALLYETEVLSALAMAKGQGYPRQELEGAWRHVLFNQFHDLLDGSAFKAAYDHSQSIFDEVTATCTSILERAAGAALSLEDAPPEPAHVTLFNPLGWERTGVARAPLPEGLGEEARVVEETSGKRIPAQIIGNDMVFTATLPSVGQSTYRIIPGDGGPGEDADAPRATAAAGPGQEHSLENRFFRLTVSPESGAITSLFDKRMDRELVAEPVNVFQVCYERPHGMSAWRIGPIIRIDNLLTGARTEVVHQGPVQAGIRVVNHFGGSRINQDIVVHRDTPRIDFVTEIEWNEVGGPEVDSPMLKVSFPFAHSSDRCIREIPFGHIESPTDGREVPSLTFLELPGDGFGVALLNDSKYGHDARGNTLRLTLLRAAYDPDPLPDIGRHHLVYSILPHEGNWKDSEVWKRGHELNIPFRLLRGRPKVPRRSWLSIESPGIDLAALKGADDGKGIIVRLVEMHGRAANTRLKIGWDGKSITKCDLREAPEDEPRRLTRDGMVTLDLGPYEVSTWRIQ